MDVHQLQVFVSVYQNRSFTKASMELNLTQPTVSQQIKRLEEELGVSLFDRIGHKTIPTREAVLLHAKAEEIIQKLSSIKDVINQPHEDVEGLVTIGASSSPGAYILPHLAAEFRKKHPKVFFQIVVKDSSEIFDMIESQRILVGVVDDKRQRAGTTSLFTIEDEMVLVGAPGFLGKNVITPLGLFRVPIIMREEESDSRKSMEKQHFMHKITLKAMNVVAILGSPDALREAVKSGLGVSILSRFAVRDDLKAGYLEEIKIRGVRMKRSFYVVTHDKRTLPKTYETFLKFMKKRLQ